MSAKKKAKPAKKALDVLARLRDADVDGYIQKAEGWRKRMEAAETQLKSGEVALLEMAKIVGVMNRSLTVEREKLAASQEMDELLKRSHETMRDVELMEEIQRLKKQLERNTRAFARLDSEKAFLWEEVVRFRNRLMDYLRWEMQLPEDARVALNNVRYQEAEDKLDDDAEEAT